MFHKSQNDEYLKTCLSRMEDDEPLVWASQFCKIIMNTRGFYGKSLNDIGCNVGQFCKAMDAHAVDPDYVGYDVEPLYLEHAERFYPNRKFEKLDLVTSTPRECDISVMSATLEHIHMYRDALKNLIESTKETVLLRTFLGENYRCGVRTKEGAETGYLIQQFKFDDVLEEFYNQDFETKVIRDEYTDSMPALICPGIVRTHYIVHGERKK